ncbi:MAG: biopolymer transporter ExbD [Candidatus Eisenbacteria bacterium]|nr:biopolymer transporter ExbD [Candidatus Eisenbacteria bacterium]
MQFRKRVKAPPDIPQASTADVAFLLLIFFISTTVFDVNQALTLILPAKGKEPVKISVRNVARIVVHDKGSITIDGQPIALDKLKQEVAARIAANDKLIVSLETAPKAPYGKMVSALDKIKLAQATRISLGLYTGQETP